MARSREKAIDILEKIAVLFPEAHCELVHSSAFELAVAVILSAQATDVSVNKISPALFARFPTAFEMAQAAIPEIESYIRSIGLYRNKAKSLSALAKTLVEQYDGEIPNTFEQMIELPGIGRKSANVLLSVWFDIPAFAVDTHVERISKRLQFSKQDDSVLEVEKKMCKAIPKELWNRAHHYFIFFGRYLCKAQRPECERCPLQEYCAYFKQKQKEEAKKQKRIK